MHLLHWPMDRGSIWLVVAALFGLLGLGRPLQAAEYTCAAGDVAWLITAINAANKSGTANTVVLAAGHYTLSAVDHATDGPTGLPSVTTR